MHPLGPRVPLSLPHSRLAQALPFSPLLASGQVQGDCGLSSLPLPGVLIQPGVPGRYLRVECVLEVQCLSCHLTRVARVNVTRGQSVPLSELAFSGSDGVCYPHPGVAVTGEIT